MPAAALLKLTSISSSPFYVSQKFPTHNWVRRTLTTTTTTTASSSAASGWRLTHPNSTTSTTSWWRYMISSAHIRIPHPSYTDNNRSKYCLLKVEGFVGQKFLHSSTPNLEEASSHHKRRGCNSHYNDIRGPATDMGPILSDHQDSYDGKKPLLPTSNSTKLLTLPTILTIGRVAAVPFLVAAFYVDTWWGPNTTTGIFLAAAITDWLDGFLARKMKQGTAFGAFLDPVADKLMVAATLVLLCTKPLEVGIFGQAPWLLTVPAIAIIGREITMSAVREWAASQDGRLSEAVAVNNLGKWKTATQMTALTILLATRDTSLIGAGTLVASGVVLLYISAWLSLWSLFVYMRKIWKVLLM